MELSVPEDMVPPAQKQGDLESMEFGLASAYCHVLLQDAARVLQLEPRAWNDEVGCVSYGGLDHYLFPVDPDIPEEDLDSACYAIRLPMIVGEDSWAIYLLELNMMLVSSTGFALAADAELGVVMVKRLFGDSLDPSVVANVIERACHVVESVVRDYISAESIEE